MRICHASNFLIGCHKKTGGAEAACYLIAKGLEEKGFLIKVLTLKHDKFNEEKLSNGLFSIENLFGKRIGRGLKIFIPFDPFIYFSAKIFFKRFKPEVLHLHNYSFLTLSLIMAAKRMKVPIIYSVYDYWMLCPTETLERPDGKSCKYFQGPYCYACFKKRYFGRLQGFLALFRKPVFNWFLGQISCFIALSDNSKQILIKYGIPESKIKTIRLPMLKESKAKLPKQIEENSIFFAGWIEKRKGLHILIKAMPEVIRRIPSVKLYALGMGTDEKEIKNINNTINMFGLEKNIFLRTERLSKEQFDKIFTKASIVAVPEQWVNMSPVMILEAMSFSKPLVVSNIGGLPEFIKDDFNGKVVEPSNIKEWEKAICSMLKNKKRLEQMRINAGIMFHKIYNRNRIFKELVEIYNQMIQKNE